MKHILENNIDLGIMEEYLMDKVEKNENIVICTFYEIRIKLNISEKQEKEFLRLAKIRLENSNYKVYFTGEEYTYNNIRKTVQNNELIVAIKA